MYICAYVYIVSLLHSTRFLKILWLSVAMTRCHIMYSFLYSLFYLVGWYLLHGRYKTTMVFLMLTTLIPNDGAELGL